MRTYIYTSISKAPNFVRFWPQLRNHKAIARQQSQTWNSRRRPWPCCKQGSIWIHPNAKKKHQISHQRRSIGIFGMNLALSIFFSIPRYVVAIWMREMIIVSTGFYGVASITWGKPIAQLHSWRSLAMVSWLNFWWDKCCLPIYVYIWYIIPSRKCRPFQGMRWRNKDPLKQSGT